MVRASLPSRTYSTKCYITDMTSKREILRDVMLSTGTTQAKLSRISGMHQPSISQFLSGRREVSDRQVDSLLSCMGVRLEVDYRPVEVNLTRSERRSWMLHQRLSSHLERGTLEQWVPTLKNNLNRLKGSVQGQPHERNLDRWMSLVDSSDLSGIREVLTGLDRESIEMREVSPMSGLLSEPERLEVLGLGDPVAA